MSLNDYLLLISKSGFAKREGKDGLLMHAPISAMFSLFFLPPFFVVVVVVVVVYHCLAMGHFPFHLWLVPHFIMN